MPQLLRHDAVRLIEGSLEALALAVASISSTKRVAFREGSAEFSQEIGLIGASAELAMGACLVHAYGPDALLRENGMFKTFSLILNDFRKLVTESRPASSFLTKGVPKPPEHRDALLRCVGTFGRLGIMRASGLHCARGLRWEATVHQAMTVSKFLSVLSSSTRLKPYLTDIPTPRLRERAPQVLIQDILANRGTRPHITASDAASLYLVLPELPDEKPEWLEALGRVAVTPSKADISLLLDIVEKAVPGVLRRVGRRGAGIPVVVQPQHPNAIPIAPHYLRRSFTKNSDRWFADIATANGRLNDNMIDLPPPDATREAFALGLEGSGILAHDATFTPHEAWPFICASLETQGTQGPYWFLIRRTIDYGQLCKQLQRAASLGNKRLAERVHEAVQGCQAIEAGKGISPSVDWVAGLLADIALAEKCATALPACYERARNTDRQATLHEEQLQAVADNRAGIAAPLLAVIEKTDSLTARSYWSRILCEAASRQEDAPAILRVLSDKSVTPAHTAARKAMRRIDFEVYGPPIAETKEAQQEN